MLCGLDSEMVSFKDPAHRPARRDFHSLMKPPTERNGTLNGLYRSIRKRIKVKRSLKFESSHSVVDSRPVCGGVKAHTDRTRLGNATRFFHF